MVFHSIVLSGKLIDVQNVTSLGAGWQEGYDNAESPTHVSSVPESLVPEDVLQARESFKLRPEHERNMRDMSRGACVLFVALVLTTGALSYAIYRKKSKSVK